MPQLFTSAIDHVFLPLLNLGINFFYLILVVPVPYDFPFLTCAGLLWRGQILAWAITAFPSCGQQNWERIVSVVLLLFAFVQKAHDFSVGCRDFFLPQCWLVSLF